MTVHLLKSKNGTLRFSPYFLYCLSSFFFRGDAVVAVAVIGHREDGWVLWAVDLEALGLAPAAEVGRTLAEEAYLAEEVQAILGKQHK